MALTPTQNRFSRYVASSTGADALDALAAVASSTPHSPVGPTRRPLVVPATPVSAACAAVAWLQRLVDVRPETTEEEVWAREGGNGVRTTEMMKAIVKDDSVWEEIVAFVKGTGRKVAEKVPGMVGRERGRETAAVFFASFESILVRETERLKDRPKWVIDNLVRAASLRKSLLVCAWEVTAAAYGRRDLVVFETVLDVLEVPPLDIVKTVEPFVRLRDMPKSLSGHIEVCGNRVLDSMAWKPDSKLVAALKQRALEVAAEKKGSAPLMGKSRSPKKAEATGEKNEITPPKNAVREFTLELFFKKLLSVASERAQELLLNLCMDAIAEPVWKSIKYALWEKWHMMVGRHLDQIIMCCVYGVAKVRRYDLKFREIIHAYQSMSHVREPSFANLVPAVFRDVLLDPHLNLVPPDRDSAQRSTRSPETRNSRGDIIKLYNQVFIHAMKIFILKFQVHPPNSHVGGQRAIPNGGSLGTSGRNSSASRLMSTSNSVLSGSSRPANGRDEDDSGDTNDTLRQTVMSSPMRVRRPFASPKRFGRVTVSPMSPGGRSLVPLRQSPGRRGMNQMMGSMTPGTRKLYAFGESPVRNLENVNRTLAESSGSRRGVGAGRVTRAVPLRFEGNGVAQRAALMRRRVADALARRSGLRSPNGGVRLVSSSEGSGSAGSGSDVVSKSNGVDA